MRPALSHFIILTQSDCFSYIWGVASYHTAALRFRRVRKITKNFVMPVCFSVCLFACLSFRMEKLGSRLKYFNVIWYFSIFLPSFKKKKTQIPFKNIKNDGYFTWRLKLIFLNISLNSFWNENCSRRKQ